MTLIERLKTLPDDAVIGFKWKSADTNNWQAESDLYTVADLRDVIDKADKWTQMWKPRDVVMPDHNS